MCFPLVISSHSSERFGRFCTSPVFWNEERGHRHPAKGSQGWLPMATDILLLCDIPCQSPLLWAPSACWDTPERCGKFLGCTPPSVQRGRCPSFPTLSKPGSACMCALGVTKYTLQNAFNLSLHAPLLPDFGWCNSAGSLQPFVDSCHFCAACC